MEGEVANSDAALCCDAYDQIGSFEQLESDLICEK